MIRNVILVSGMACALLLGGCESAQKAGGAGGMNDAIADYHAARYAQAHQKAVAVQEKSTAAGQKEDAAYVAGLAAYQMGQSDEAEKRFMTASRSSNSETAAKAKAMMGQLRLDQGRPRDAAVLFVEASPHLTGEDAKKCAHNTAVAYQQAGDAMAARKWASQAGVTIPTAAPVYASASPAPQQPSSTSGGVRTAPAPAPAGGFALQVGAFKDRQHAQKAAEEAQRLISGHGLGPVRIIPRRDDRGGMLHVVQFGQFPSREAAAAARTKIGRLNYIVSPLSNN